MHSAVLHHLKKQSLPLRDAPVVDLLLKLCDAKFGRFLLLRENGVRRTMSGSEVVARRRLRSQRVAYHKHSHRKARWHPISALQPLLAHLQVPRQGETSERDTLRTHTCVVLAENVRTLLFMLLVRILAYMQI